LAVTNVIFVSDLFCLHNHLGLRQPLQKSTFRCCICKKIPHCRSKPTPRRTRQANKGHKGTQILYLWAYGDIFEKNSYAIWLARKTGKL